LHLLRLRGVVVGDQPHQYIGVKRQHVGPPLRLESLGSSPQR
jgi:hypothetical protein